MNIDETCLQSARHAVPPVAYVRAAGARVLLNHAEPHNLRSLIGVLQVAGNKLEVGSRSSGLT